MVMPPTEADMLGRYPVITQLLACGVKVAEKAGWHIRNVLASGDLQTTEKTAPNDVVTKADVRSQRCIVDSFHARFKNASFTIIGEEEESDREKCELELEVSHDVLNKACPQEWASVRQDQVTIWVDPLDGTNEFAHANSDKELAKHVTVLIGFAVGEEAVAGVVHQPFYPQPDGSLGRTIWGCRGLGSFGANFVPPPEGENIITTTRSHPSEVVTRTIEAMHPTRVMPAGGAGHKVILVLEGRANAYVYASKGCKKWDTCAPEAVLTALGGKLTDIYGKSYKYHSTVAHMNMTGVLAIAPGQDHSWYTQRVPDDIKTVIPPET